MMETTKRVFELIEKRTGASRLEIISLNNGRSLRVSEARKIAYLVLSNGQNKGASATGRICNRTQTNIGQTNIHTIETRPDLISKAIDIQVQLNAEAQL